MAILTHYNINRFMYPLTHCNDLDKEQKEKILKYACESIEKEDHYSDFTGSVIYRDRNGDIIAELKTNGFCAIEGQYKLVKFNGVKNASSSINDEYWKLFKLFREETLLEGFNVLRKFVDDDKIKKLRKKAYYCIDYWHPSAYKYEMEGYNDGGVDLLCENLEKTYCYYDENFDLILEFKHYYNKGEMKIRENTVF